MTTIAAALVVAGCGSTPAPRFHSLLGAESVMGTGASVAPALPPGTTRSGIGASASTAVGAFVLEPIRLPASVDQPQWLVRLPDESLVSLESERWASPLRDEFRQALLAELVGRYGLVDARDDRAFLGAAWRVRVDVLRFESIAGREARIEGAWTITASTPIADGPVAAPASARPSTPVASIPLVSRHCTWRFTEPVGVSMSALAAAHRRNVMRLADAIGAAVIHLQHGDAAMCSSD